MGSHTEKEKCRPNPIPFTNGSKPPAGTAQPAVAGGKDYWNDGEQAPTIAGLLALNLGALKTFGQFRSVFKSIERFRAILEDLIERLSSETMGPRSPRDVFAHGLGVQLALREDLRRLAAVEQFIGGLRFRDANAGLPPDLPDLPVVEDEPAVPSAASGSKPATQGPAPSPVPRTGTDG